MFGLKKPQAKDLIPFLKKNGWFKYLIVEIKHDINQYFYLKIYFSQEPLNLQDNSLQVLRHQLSSSLFDSKGSEKAFKNREAAFKLSLNIIDSINELTEAEAEVICGRTYFKPRKECK